jgi:two-component system chemotaxis response regulator CheY
MSILVVDDSAMIRTMIKRAAGATGLPIAHIYEASDGRQALAVLEQHQVDALFTDINMPVMSGIDLLKEISATRRWPNLVRVIISTDGSEARRHEADLLNVRLYVEKPFRPEVLRDVLSELTRAR